MPAPRLTLPLWYDLHMHFRQGDLLAPLADRHRAMGCCGALAMPNTKPPVTEVFRKYETDTAWSIEHYLADLRAVWPDALDLIVPLYLSPAATPAMISAGAKAGLLRAAKYYPPHGTTNAEHGAPLQHFIDNGVIAALAEHNVVLCLHGEAHHLSGEAYFGKTTSAEAAFYRELAPRLVEKFPTLRIVAEHVTTKVAADFVQRTGPHVAATVTPQHLLYTVGHLVQGLRFHLYCLPLLKFDEDLQALRAAVTGAGNTKFFAGTDSAPHTTKATACGCAAGCYTGGIAPQLYAQAFEEAGSDLAAAAGQAAFKKFLCDNGRVFYGLKAPDKTFTLSREPQEVTLLQTKAGAVTPLPLGLAATEGKATLNWRAAC